MHSAHGLQSLTRIKDEKIRSITMENQNGDPGAGGTATSQLGPRRKGNPCINDVEPGETRTLADIQGPGEIRHIWITLPDETDAGSNVLRDVVLRMYWDGEDDPSVEVPIGDFFCNGHGTRCTIDSGPIAVVPDGGFNCYFPMPFRDRATITIESTHPGTIPCFFYQVDYAEGVDVSNATAYFHAQWRRENPTTKGEDYTVLGGVEGSGNYVGTYLALTALEKEWWGEGEMKFYFDGDDEYPTICGTGTEDYVGGAWGFNDPSKHDEVGFPEPETYSTRYLGYPFFDAGDSGQGRPPRHGMYRWHVPDPIRFDEELRVTLQQIGHDGRDLFERSDDIASVAYWYQQEPHAPFPALPDRAERKPR